MKTSVWSLTETMVLSSLWPIGQCAVHTRLGTWPPDSKLTKTMLSKDQLSVCR